MANKFVTALFGDYSKKEIKKLRKTIDKINSCLLYTSDAADEL